MTPSVVDYHDTSPEDGGGKGVISSPVFGGGVSVLR